MALLLPVCLFGKDGVDASVRMVGGIGMGGNKNKSFGSEGVVGYRVNEYFRSGIGFGISWCDLLFEKKAYLGEDYREEEAFIPIYLNGKANFVKEGISPYFSLNIGYSALIPFSGNARESELGLMANPAFGVDFPLSKGSFSLETGYKYQAMKYRGDDGASPCTSAALSN